MASKAKKKSQVLVVSEGSFYAVNGKGIMKCTKAPNEKGIALFNQSFSAPVSEVTGTATYADYKKSCDKSIKATGAIVRLSEPVRKFMAQQPTDACMADVVLHFIAMDEKTLARHDVMWMELFRVTDVVGLYYLVHDVVKFAEAGKVTV
jgi:hypothetical protein